MNAGDESWRVWPPTGSPQQLHTSHRDDYYDPNWKQLDNSVNAVSFGFVATAILIAMFLVMAIFERFLRPVSFASSSGASTSDVEAQMGFHSKLRIASPKMSVYSRGVSVLMPGEDTPTFIAHPAPAPAPCPQERIHWPLHHPTPPQSTIISTQSAISGMDTEESRPLSVSIRRTSYFEGSRRLNS